MSEVISKGLIGVAGEYYVCAELCRRNILALVTPKNNPLFDVVASDPVGQRVVSIQVKTMSMQNERGWRLNKDITIRRGNANLFVVLVDMKAGGTNDYYVYEYDSLAERVGEVYAQYFSRPKRDGSPRQEVSFRWFDYRDFNEEDRQRLNNWALLGFSR